MSDEIRVNGLQFSWGSVKVKIDGETYHGISSIKYSDKIDPQKTYGQGRHQGPRGRTRGKYTADNVEIEVPKGSAATLRAWIANRAGKTSIGQFEFPIVVQYIDEGENPITDQIEQCRLIENNSNAKEGSDALTETVTFDCMRIRWNGLTLFDESAG